MVTFTGLSPKQAQSIEVLKNHISLPDVEVAVAQSDQASISIKGEKGQYQLTYRKPHQLYRALSVLATSSTLPCLICARNSFSRRGQGRD